MRYAGIIKNDFAAAPKTCVTFFSQGCPHRCEGCHNPETWEFGAGKEFTQDTLDEIIAAINANGFQRDFCVMGGEPMCNANAFLTYMVISQVKKVYPTIKVYLWSGYTYEELKANTSPRVRDILKLTDVLIDGKFEKDLQDKTLFMRGSSNQRIIDLKAEEDSVEKE